jgi:hypothetical protein
MLRQAVFTKDAFVEALFFQLVFTIIGKVSSPTTLDNIAKCSRQHPSRQGNRSIVLPR